MALAAHAVRATPLVEVLAPWQIGIGLSFGWRGSKLQNWRESLDMDREFRGWALRVAFLLALSVVAMAGLIFPSPAFAQNCVMPAGYHSNVRPDPEGKPTVIKFGILVADVTEIDDISQTIEGDFIVRKSWTDPRFAGLAGCRFPRSAVWFPITDVLNSAQLKRTRGEFAADQVRISQGGLVEYRQRFFGKIATYHQLKRFPFDSHRLRIRIAALDYPADEVQLDLDSEFTGVAGLLNIPDWRINGVDTGIVVEVVPEFDAAFSILILDILASRESQYYVWKIMAPMLLIVMMSFVVFWVNPERFGPQIGLTATSMLTLIAFQFATTSMLPKLSYFTLMDELILGSTILVFGALVEATVTAVLVTRGQEEIALRIDRACRWLFPAALFVVWALALSG